MFRAKNVELIVTINNFFFIFASSWLFILFKTFIFVYKALFHKMSGIFHAMNVI